MKKLVTLLIVSVSLISCVGNRASNYNVIKECSTEERIQKIVSEVETLAKINYDSLYRSTSYDSWHLIDYHIGEIASLKMEIATCGAFNDACAFANVLKNTCDSLTMRISSIRKEQKEMQYKKELKKKYGNAVVKKLFSYVVSHDVRGNGSRVYKYFNPCDLSIDNAFALCEKIKVLSKSIPNFLTTKEDDINDLMFTDINDRTDISYMRKKYSLYRSYGQARVERVLEWQDIDTTARLLSGNFCWGDSNFIKTLAKDRSSKWYNVLTEEERLKKDKEERDAFFRRMAEDRIKYEQEQKYLKTFNKTHTISVAYTPFGEVLIVSEK